MSRLADKLLVCAYVAVAILPITAVGIHLGQRKVYGTLPPTPRPALSWAGTLDDSYQHGFTAWFESSLGLKGYSMYLDNTILYHALGETKPGSVVRVGVDDMLFIDEDLNFFNRDTDLFDPARLDQLVGKILVIQTKLAAQHRAFVPLIIPSKTTIYRDRVPSRSTRDLGLPRVSDERLYLAMKRALEKHGVRYVDGRELLLAAKQPRELLWSATARHWSEFGACLALREVVTQYTALTGLPLAYDCEVHREPRPKQHDDYDLWRLVNAWRVPREAEIPVVAHSQAPVDVPKPRTMFVGTSFCWTLLRDATRSKRFGTVHMDYYNKTLVASDESIVGEVHAGTPGWRDVFLAKDLYVLDLFEVYLGVQDSYVDNFVGELGAALP